VLYSSLKLFNANKKERGGNFTLLVGSGFLDQAQEELPIIERYILSAKQLKLKNSLPQFSQNSRDSSFRIIYCI